MGVEVTLDGVPNVWYCFRPQDQSPYVDAFLQAAGGALGAGLSSRLTSQAKRVDDDVTGATGLPLLGGISSNILAGLGGALVRTTQLEQRFEVSRS
ncbi:hypothetical protein SAMN05192543_103488 [Paraburkholderia megapolitana]|uniref:Uncharacterized protein n=1 Tax=Paraburkholderia megapolitana TaxID=420953 RepID=A0A1I3IZK9_9BURK|nr:hypothetical protein SAMN05192543_103488 [Paraburkholderia megapolitana]